MSTDCTNTITIISGDADDLDEFIQNELQIHEDDDDHADGEYEFVENVVKRGRNGIQFEYITSSAPPLEWLQEVLGRYPSFWIKNEWNEEGGKAGVWLCSVGENDEQIVKSFEWIDLCLEARQFFFSEDDLFRDTDLVEEGDCQFESEGECEGETESDDDSNLCCLK